MGQIKSGARCSAGIRSDECPLWVKSRHMQCKTACPLYPRKRTCAVQTGMSALGHKQTVALHQPMSALPPKRDICERSNGRGARIVSEQPFVPGLHLLFLPLSVDKSFRT